MEQFESLLRVAETLLGPNGCPWDRKQTFFSLQPYVLEEAHEVIEAVDADDDQKMVEELGDLLYTVVFFGKLGEIKGRFSMSQIIEGIREKLIRRHPHVFGDLSVKDEEEVIKNWEEIKKQEKGKGAKERESDGIPATLHALGRAQKIARKMIREDSSQFSDKGGKITEEEVGEKLFHLIAQAERNGIDAESALRRTLKSVSFSSPQPE